MRINSGMAMRYMIILLATIACLLAIMVFSHDMADLREIENWQLAAFEILAYLTACYNWDRRAGVPVVIGRAAVMMVSRVGLAALAAFGIRQWWSVGSYSDAFMQAMYASQPVAIAEVAYVILVFALPFRVMRKPDWSIWDNRTI